LIGLQKKFKYPNEAGCDEVGRGCLAGPVVAAAVILNPRKIHPDVQDSKKIPAAKREELYHWIKANARAYGIGVIEPLVIDEINILQASFRAMHLALDQLELRPRHILVDGNRFIPYQDIHHTCVIKGDGIYYSIAAASILAKHYRDTLMTKLHHQYPEYCWNTNMGYPTVAHRTAIARSGTCPQHRMSFRLLPE
jgi:ribonuclease HII